MLSTSTPRGAAPTRSTLIDSLARSLRRPGPSIAAALLIAGCAAPPKAVFGPPPPERVRSISTGDDAERMARARVRIGALSSAASATRTYHLAKADAWLDFAADAGRRDAGGDAAEDALDQALALIGALERGRSPALRTLHVVASRIVHPELWAAADEIRNSSGFPCAADPLARAEVALVWSGHRAHVGDADGAEEIAARAQGLLSEARSQVGNCLSTAATGEERSGAPRWAPAAAMPGAAPETERAAPNLPDRELRPERAAARSVAQVEEVRLPTDALFPFGATRLAAARGESLRELAKRILATPNLALVRIGGHTDRLSRSGRDFNMALSQARARAVGDALVALGIDASRIEVQGHGDAVPVVECPGRRSRAVIDCLAPNRRVMIEILRSE